MNTIYKLVGYSRATDHLLVAYPIPSAMVDRIMGLAGMHPPVSDLLGDWRLADNGAREIAQLLGHDIDLQTTEFFLEPYVDAPDHVQRRHG